MPFELTTDHIPYKAKGSKVTSKLWYEANKEKCSLKNKQWYLKNREKQIESNKEYYQLHKLEISVRRRKNYLETGK